MGADHVVLPSVGFLLGFPLLRSVIRGTFVSKISPRPPSAIARMPTGDFGYQALSPKKGGYRNEEAGLCCGSGGGDGDWAWLKC
jgi:hypothetical protein